MQYPVPQFTDVEDKIIGPLTLKQFLIIFAAGVVVFLAFTVSQSVPAAILVFLLFGVPALGLAFAKVNGRPLYNTMFLFLNFLLSPKVLYFHKESSSFTGSTKFKNVDMEASPDRAVPVSEETTKSRLQEVTRLLSAQVEEEKELSKKIV